MCFSFFTMDAQVIKDTSYTVWNSYKKDVKKYPFITVAAKDKSPFVTVNYDCVYKTISERSLHVDVFFSARGKSKPGVILIHGGGWKSGDKKQMWLLAQEIALKGYSCFCVEYRLSDEAKFPQGIFDIKEAIRFVKANARKFNVNPKKIAVLGCSSGGQMATLVGTTNNNSEFEEQSILKTDTRIEAIIDMDGVLAFHHPQSQESDVAAAWLGGKYADMPLVWDKASALTHTGKHTPPILFIGSDKPRFQAGREDMVAILNTYGIYNDTKKIDNSPHSFWFYNPWFDQIVDWSVTFLDKVFK